MSEKKLTYIPYILTYIVTICHILKCNFNLFIWWNKKCFCSDKPTVHLQAQEVWSAFQQGLAQQNMDKLSLSVKYDVVNNNKKKSQEESQQIIYLLYWHCTKSPPK